MQGRGQHGEGSASRNLSPGGLLGGRSSYQGFKLQVAEVPCSKNKTPKGQVACKRERCVPRSPLPSPSPHAGGLGSSHLKKTFTAAK